MIRILTLAAAATAFAAPVFAADAAAPASEAAPQIRAHLNATSAALQARQHLVRQGYVNVSDLEQDALGRWSGTASKDGKTVIVAIKLPAVTAAAASN
ncbi:MAG: hypothetical protein HOP09_00495 [Hyphomicrobium sp.]|nr:hypothetical protein [Hyphomicrobium sp.]